ncbi:recombinase RecT [Limoniibacter endophyticus]|uniref:Phage recombination protein Bet n=1 Tax=Limoniibacter endophyticus TaxID=1565040 RepID=A0A8J3DL43_9HYPH|nr:recombinase RecT [Limoniibacter endophyticus]GHC79622.1 hypothetical protein GCM10010136_32340 [Limoniibacter endophyticus]
MNAIVQADAPRLPSLQSGGAVRAIVPQDFDGAWRIATAVCKAGMAPKGLDTPEKAMVAIMHGMEVGMTPMAALQSIAVVNGRPTIWGDGAIGLVRGSGKCEWIKERIDGEGDGAVAVCEVKRKGEADAIKATFSVLDAKKASLWGKAGPWQQYPKRMLAMRARAFALRDGFADVLRGLGIAEEVQDTPQRDSTVQATRPPAPPAPPSIDHQAEEIDHREIVQETGESVDAIMGDGEPFDIENYVQELEDALAIGQDEATLTEIWDSFDVEATLTDDQMAMQRAFDIRKKHVARIGGGQ